MDNLNDAFSFSASSSAYPGHLPHDPLFPPASGARPKPSTGNRRKRSRKEYEQSMAYEIDEDSEDEEGVEEGNVSSASSTVSSDPSIDEDEGEDVDADADDEEQQTGTWQPSFKRARTRKRNSAMADYPKKCPLCVARMQDKQWVLHLEAVYAFYVFDMKNEHERAEWALMRYNKRYRSMHRVMQQGKQRSLQGMNTSLCNRLISDSSIVTHSMMRVPGRETSTSATNSRLESGSGSGAAASGERTTFRSPRLLPQEEEYPDLTVRQIMTHMSKHIHEPVLDMASTYEFQGSMTKKYEKMIKNLSRETRGDGETDNSKVLTFNSTMRAYIELTKSRREVGIQLGNHTRHLLTRVNDVMGEKNSSRAFLTSATKALSTNGNGGGGGGDRKRG